MGIIKVDPEQLDERQWFERRVGGNEGEHVRHFRMLPEGGTGSGTNTFFAPVGAWK